MSDEFANIIGKAMNTPPVRTIKLKIGERIEVRHIDGRIFTPLKLIIDNKEEEVSNFEILAERPPIKDIVDDTISRPYSCFLDPYGSFHWIGTFPQARPLTIPSNGTLFLTLRVHDNYKTDVETGVLEYSYATPY